MTIFSYFARKYVKDARKSNYCGVGRSTYTFSIENLTDKTANCFIFCCRVCLVIFSRIYVIEDCSICVVTAVNDINDCVDDKHRTYAMTITIKVIIPIPSIGGDGCEDEDEAFSGSLKDYLLFGVRT